MATRWEDRRTPVRRRSGRAIGAVAGISMWSGGQHPTADQQRDQYRDRDHRDQATSPAAARMRTTRTRTEPDSRTTRTRTSRIPAARHRPTAAGRPVRFVPSYHPRR